MSVTCAELRDRALDRNVANRGSSLVSDDAILLARLAEYEDAVFHRLASEQRTYYQTSAALTSSASVGGAARTATLPTDCLRVLRVYRTLDNTEVAPVDFRFPETEYAPRYFLRGTTIVEVYPDWDTGSASAVALTVDYVRGPAQPIDPNGALTQQANLPDEYTDLLDNRLARYFAQKDLGRDPQELVDLDQQYEARFQQFLRHLDALAGTSARGFAPPVPEGKA